jgi:hypothetical protein
MMIPAVGEQHPADIHKERRHRDLSFHCFNQLVERLVE